MKARILIAGALALFLPAVLEAAERPSGKGAKDKGASRDESKKSGSTHDPQIERALLQATQKFQASHLKDLEGVVSWAAASGLVEDAGKLIAKMAALDPEYGGLAKLKAAAAKAKPQEDAAKVEDLRKTLARKIEDANEKNAKRLFGLATDCMKLGLFSRAYDLVNAVLEADPDHKRARDVLSYAWDPAAKTWVTKWEADMKKKCFLTDEGWVKKEDKKKWDAGQRDYLGKWVSKEEEERLRKRSDSNPFSVDTEHFTVRTNLGRAQAYEFATLLEGFYRQFFRFFIGYYDQVAGAKLLFNQAKLASKHQVNLFPSRVEYLTFVKQDMGNDELLVRSGGFYSSAHRQSYFFWSADRDRTLNVLYHEVTHQLLDETRSGGKGNSGQVWVVEGIATYMETWENVGGKWKPGHRLTDEMALARRAVAGGDFNLARYIATEHKEFHEPSRRSYNYSMGGALCHFFLHARDEVYKERFVEFLRDYYIGKARGDDLLKYLEVEGVSGQAAKCQALEKQFKEYLAALGESDAGDAAAAPPPKKDEGDEGDKDAGDEGGN